MLGHFECGLSSQHLDGARRSSQVSLPRLKWNLRGFGELLKDNLFLFPLFCGTFWEVEAKKKYGT